MRRSPVRPRPARFATVLAVGGAGLLLIDVTVPENFLRPTPAGSGQRPNPR
jgi:hypothetical protein